MKSEDVERDNSDKTVWLLVYCHDVDVDVDAGGTKPETKRR